LSSLVSPPHRNAFAPMSMREEPSMPTFPGESSRQSPLPTVSGAHWGGRPARKDRWNSANLCISMVRRRCGVAARQDPPMRRLRTADRGPLLPHQTAESRGPRCWPAGMSLAASEVTTRSLNTLEGSSRLTFCGPPVRIGACPRLPSRLRQMDALRGWKGRQDMGIGELESPYRPVAMPSKRVVRPTSHPAVRRVWNQHAPPPEDNAVPPCAVARSDLLGTVAVYRTRLT
jgi:hypothetical protein